MIKFFFLYDISMIQGERRNLTMLVNLDCFDENGLVTIEVNVRSKCKFFSLKYRASILRGSQTKAMGNLP